MNVVSHENIGMDMAPVASAGLLQVVTETTIIFIGNKNWAPVITFLNDMLWLSGQHIAGNLGMGLSPCRLDRKSIKLSCLMQTSSIPKPRFQSSLTLLFSC